MYYDGGDRNVLPATSTTWTTVTVGSLATPTITLKRTSAAKVDRNATAAARRFVVVKGVVKGATTGRVQLVVNGVRQTAKASVSNIGTFTLKWDPANNAKLGSRTLKVHYDGSDQNLLPATSKTSTTVNVVR